MTAHDIGRLLSCQYKARGTLGVYNLARMNEKYRPFTKHEKRMHQLRYEPRMYEHRRIPELKQEAKGAQEARGSSWAILLLMLLNMIIGLPDFEESGIEGGKIVTPQSTLIGRS
jgi:hypothetical protein